jgi:hypothetical protein
MESEVEKRRMVDNEINTTESMTSAQSSSPLNQPQLIIELDELNASISTPLLDPYPNISPIQLQVADTTQTTSINITEG